MSIPKSFIQEFLTQHSPYCQVLQLAIVDIGDTSLRLRMPYQAELIGDPDTGVVHGGAVSALLDTCCGAAVFAHPLSGGMTATISLRIDYMRPALPKDDLIAHAEVYHVTRTVAFVRGSAWSASHSEDKAVALATGSFTFRRQEQS